MGSAFLFSPNISAARAYVCPGNSFISSLDIFYGYGNTNSREKDPPSSISDIAGNCSDGTQLPGFTYDFFNSQFRKDCSPLGYPSNYTYDGSTYTYQDQLYSLSRLAEQLTYRQISLVCSLPTLIGAANLSWIWFSRRHTKWHSCCLKHVTMLFVDLAMKFGCQKR